MAIGEEFLVMAVKDMGIEPLAALNSWLPCLLWEEAGSHRPFLGATWGPWGLGLKVLVAHRKF